MTGQIPKYGKYFALEQLPYHHTQDLASRRYVLKANRKYSIRSTRDSEHWQVYIEGGTPDAQFPAGPVHNTLTEAMAFLLSKADAWDIEGLKEEKTGMHTPVTTHPIKCPAANAGHTIVASVTIPDTPGLVTNRYAVVAHDRTVHNTDLYCTWVISPYNVQAVYTHTGMADCSWSGDQGHYSLEYRDALRDMVSRALQG